MNILVWIWKSPWVLAGIFFSIIYTAIGILFALNSHDSNFDFAVFQCYRIVFNNLEFPEVTAYNAMTHPGDAQDLHLYSTILSPLYIWWMTLWSTWVGLETHWLRIGGVLIYFAPIMWGSQALSKQCGGQAWFSSAIYLLAPLLIVHSIACDLIVFSLGFLILVLSELCKPSPSSKRLFLYSFVAVFFQFLNSLHLALILLTLLSFQRFRFKGQKLNLACTISAGAGSFTALMLSLFFRSLADERIPSFFDYFLLRSDQAIVQPYGLSFYFFTLERVWGADVLQFSSLFIVFYWCWRCSDP